MSEPFSQLQTCKNAPAQVSSGAPALLAQKPSAPQHGGPSGSRAIPRTAPTGTGHSPLAKTQQIKLHQEFLCSRSSSGKCIDRFPQTTASRIDGTGRYSESREFRSRIPLLAGMCATISRSSSLQRHSSEVIGGESQATRAAEFCSGETSLQLTQNGLYKIKIYQSNEGLGLHANGAHINQNDSLKDLQK